MELSFSTPSLISKHMRCQPGFWSLDSESILGVAGGVMMPGKTTGYFFSSNGGDHWDRPWYEILTEI